MKQTSTRLAALALLSVTAMLAQRPFGPRAQGTPPDPATMVQNQVARLTTMLNLTSAQVSTATSIFTAAQTTVTPLQTTLNTTRQSLEAAVKTNATANIEQLSATVGSLTGQITAAQSKAHAAFYAILTTDQQATLNQHGGLGGPGGMGRRGGFGPGGPGGPPPQE